MVRYRTAQLRACAANILPASPKDTRSRRRFLNFFHRRPNGGSFHSHREKRAEKQERRTPDLWQRKTFVEKDGGEAKRADGAKELKGLGKSDSDLANRHVIQNVGKTDAGYGGDNQDNVHPGLDLQWRRNVPKRQRERQKQRGSDESDHAKDTNRSEPRGRPFHQDTVERPAEACRKCDGDPLE